jgi:hypothetical protein
MQTHPDLQLILYISGSGGLLERMAACNPDIISIDQAVDMRDAIKRIGPSFAVQVPPPPRAGGMSGFLAGKSAQEPTVPHIWLATSIRSLADFPRAAPHIRRRASSLTCVCRAIWTLACCLAPRM